MLWLRVFYQGLVLDQSPLRCILLLLCFHSTPQSY